jgi:hypothetical protein
VKEPEIALVAKSSKDGENGGASYPTNSECSNNESLTPLDGKEEAEKSPHSDTLTKMTPKVFGGGSVFGDGFGVVKGVPNTKKLEHLENTTTKDEDSGIFTHYL